MMQLDSTPPAPLFANLDAKSEWPCDIADALSQFLSERSAKDAQAFVLGRHMVCIAPDAWDLWPIDPDDLATAQDVIANELKQIVLWQEQNRLTPARLVAELRAKAGARASTDPELAEGLRLLADTYAPGAATA